MTVAPLLAVYGPKLGRLRELLGDAPDVDAAVAALDLWLSEGGGGDAAPAVSGAPRMVGSAVGMALYAVEPGAGAGRTGQQATPQAGQPALGDGDGRRTATDRVLDRLRGSRPKADQEAAGYAPPQADAPAAAVVDADTLVNAVRAALEAVDTFAQAALASLPEPERPPWYDDRELTGALHRVLAAGLRGQGGFALSRIAELEETLSSQGVHTVRYDPGADGPAGDRTLFDFVEGARPGAPGMTLDPALLARDGDQRLLRRGRVRPAAPAGNPDVPVN